MAEGKHHGALGAVYDAKRPDEVAALYDGWATTYDSQMSAAGYRHPTICLALLARHLPRGSAPLLDAGAGTGLIGEWLGIMGYPHVEARTFRKACSRKPNAKGAYAALHCLALGGPLPFPDGHFAGIVSAGVFTSGHVGAEGLGELVRICRPGGASSSRSRTRSGNPVSPAGSPISGPPAMSPSWRRPSPMCPCPASRARTQPRPCAAPPRIAGCPSDADGNGGGGSVTWRRLRFTNAKCRLHCRSVGVGQWFRDGVSREVWP